MKKTLLALFLFYNLTSCSQSLIIAGDYGAKYGAVQYQLTLNPDGTFLFHSYNKFNGGLPAEPSISGKGTWQTEKNIVLFSMDEQRDLDYAHTLIFNNSKAVFEGKSTGIMGNGTIVTKLTFLKSDIFWLEGIELKRRNT